jgi:hypothetical protein
LLASDPVYPALAGTQPAGGKKPVQLINPLIKHTFRFGLKIGWRRAFHVDTSLSKHVTMGYYYITNKNVRLEMQFEYTVELLALDEIRGMGNVAESKDNVVYACAEDGECTVHDLGKEQMDRFQDYLNRMGKEGWEMVQLFFGPTGVVTFWKRQLTPEE